MKNSFVVALICLVGFEFSSALPSFAAKTGQQIVAELTNAKILRSDQSLSADVSGKFATISTYSNRATTNKDVVCKLDALLIAKKVMEIAPEISVVRVWFHEYTGSKYKEVSVSKDDLKNFESGKLKKDQLLARLKLRNLFSVESSETYRKSAANTPQLSTVRTSTGVAFYYPAGWRQEIVKASGQLAELSYGTDANGPGVLLKIDPQTERLSADELRKISVGQGAEGSERTGTYEDGGRQIMERRVYFTDGRYKYQMILRCPTDNFSKSSADFSYMISTLNVKKHS